MQTTDAGDGHDVVAEEGFVGSEVGDSRREVPSVLLAGASIGITVVVAPDLALFVGMLIFVVLLLMRYGLNRRHTTRTARA